MTVHEQDILKMVADITIAHVANSANRIEPHQVPQFMREIYQVLADFRSEAPVVTAAPVTAAPVTAAPVTAAPVTAAVPAQPAPATAVDIPPPPKKLFGAALKSYEERMRRTAAEGAVPRAVSVDTALQKDEAPAPKLVEQAPSEAPVAAKTEEASVNAAQSASAKGPETNQKPAVPIEESIKPDVIVCLEDGKELKMLKRYLRAAYNMTPEEYRAKWGLPDDYPMVAPGYAAEKSAYAKMVGLGRHHREKTES